MSADNWTACPVCERKALEARTAKQIKAAKAYGKVAAEEWQRMTNEANAEVEVKETFREDYEFCMGTSKGGPHEFLAVYSGVCTRCGFSHKFEHRENLEKKILKEKGITDPD